MMKQYQLVPVITDSTHLHQQQQQQDEEEEETEEGEVKEQRQLANETSASSSYKHPPMPTPMPTPPIALIEEPPPPASSSPETMTTFVIQSSDIDSIVSAAPKETRHKYKAILAYLINAKTRAKQDSYRIIYSEGGVIGSPLQNLLRWTVSPDRGEDRPWDQMRFFRLLTDLGVPKSLYGAGKYKLAKVASKPIPVAIVRKGAAEKNCITTTAATTGTSTSTSTNTTTGGAAAAASHGAGGNRPATKMNGGGGGEDNDEAPPEKRWKHLF